MPAILHVLPARYPQEQFALPLPRRTRYIVEFRRHAQLIARQYAGSYEVRVRKEVAP